MNKNDLPIGWIPFAQGTKFLAENTMANGEQGVKFVLDNFSEHKYLNIRIDMRTGQMLIKPGD